MADTQAQPYTIEFPLNAEQAANINEMFQILFDHLRMAATTITANSANTLAVAEVAARVSVRT